MQFISGRLVRSERYRVHLPFSHHPTLKWIQDKKNQQTSHKKAHKTIPTTTNQQTGSVPSRPSGPHRFVAYTNRAPRAARKIVHRLVQEGGFPSSTDPFTDDKMGERLLCFFLLSLPNRRPVQTHPETIRGGRRWRSNMFS